MHGIALIDHALFVGLGATIGVAPAAAQQTPASYCKTLAATSCEVLNVEPASMVLGSYVTSFFLVKQCRNQNFETRVIELANIDSGASRISILVAQQSGTTNPPSAYPYGTNNGGWVSYSNVSGRTSSPINGSPYLDMALTCN